MIRSVSVRVVGAEGLVTKDNKPADPYVRLCLNEKKYKTKKKEKTLSPKWNEHFLFAFVQINSTTTLEVKVYDSTIGKDTFLGTCLVRVEEHLKLPSPPEWFQLLPREGKKDKVGGKINLVLSYSRNSVNPTIKSSMSEDMDSSESEPGSVPSTPHQASTPLSTLGRSPSQTSARASFSKSEDNISIGSLSNNNLTVDIDSRYASAGITASTIVGESISPSSSPRSFGAGSSYNTSKELQHFPAHLLPIPHSSFDNLRNLSREDSESLSSPSTQSLSVGTVTPTEISSPAARKRNVDSGRFDAAKAKKNFFHRKSQGNMSVTDIEMRTVKAEHEARAKTLNIPLPYSDSLPSSLTNLSLTQTATGGSSLLPSSAASMTMGSFSAYSAASYSSSSVSPSVSSSSSSSSSSSFSSSSSSISNSNNPLSSPSLNLLNNTSGLPSSHGDTDDYTAWQIKMNKESGTLLLSKTVFSFSPHDRMDLILIWTKDIKSMDMSDIRKTVTVKTNSKTKHVFDIPDKATRDRFYDTLKTTWEFTRKKFDMRDSGSSSATATAGSTGETSGGLKVYTGSELPAYQDKVCKDLFGDEGNPAFVFTEVEGLFNDPTSLAGEPLTSTTLSISLRGFFSLTWSDSAEFMKHVHMDDGNVEIGKWGIDPSKAFFTRSVSFVKKSRLATAKVFRTEKLKVSATKKELFLESSNRMEGIPFADQFTVESRWKMTTEESGKTNIKVWAYCEFKPNLGFAAKAAKGRIIQGSVDGVAELAKTTVEFLTNKIGNSSISEDDKAKLGKTKSMSSLSSYTSSTANSSSSKLSKVFGNKQNIIYLIAAINLLLLVIVVYQLSHGFALSNELASLTEAHSSWSSQQDSLLEALKKAEDNDLLQKIYRWLSSTKEGVSLLTAAVPQQLQQNNII